MDATMAEWTDLTLSVFHIILVNFALSGDNVLVIAMTARMLPAEQRKSAITWGIILAVVFRILLTMAAVALVHVPGLMIVGGIILFIIACRLLLPEESPQQEVASLEMTEMNTDELPRTNYFRAIRMICVADIVMSLDNVLAVAGASNGNVPHMLIGLLASLVLILFCSRWIASLMDRFRGMVYVGAGVLSYTAAGMIVSSHEVVALWGNATQMIHRFFTVSETALATMSNSYSIFSHAFSLVAVTGCIVYGVQKKPYSSAIDFQSIV